MFRSINYNSLILLEGPGYSLLLFMVSNIHEYIVKKQDRDDMNNLTKRQEYQGLPYWLVPLHTDCTGTGSVHSMEDISALGMPNRQIL